MYNVYAEFPRQQICKDRQYSGLIRWSGYIVALPIPTEKPEEAWVEQRLVAARVPSQMATYVDATMAWVLRDPAIQTNIRQHLNAFNDEATEAAMDANVDGALAAQMPGYCHTVVSQGEINAWYAENGFETAPLGQMLGRAGSLNDPLAGGTR